MGVVRKRRSKRKISTEKVSDVLKELKLTKLRKQWRQESSTLAAICARIGRKNNYKNRLAIWYLIKKKSKTKLMGRSPKNKYRRSFYATAFPLRRNVISLKQSPQNMKHQLGKTTEQELETRILTSQDHKPTGKHDIYNSY